MFVILKHTQENQQIWYNLIQSNEKEKSAQYKSMWEATNDTKVFLQQDLQQNLIIELSLIQ